MNTNFLINSILMKNRCVFFVILFISLLSQVQAQTKGGGHMYRLYLKDKGNPPYTLDKPEEFLSKKAIERRTKQGIAIDSTDFPIDPVYLNQIKSKHADIKAMSKWLKTVTVCVSDNSIVDELVQLPFVNSATFVWTGTFSFTSKNKEKDNLSVQSKTEINPYGSGFSQINIHHGDLLHDAGFRGEGINIAVLDGGFMNCDQIDAFNKSQIIEVKNFTHEDINPFRIQTDHGTKVLSCMLANKPGSMIGTAPEASYYLYTTEVPNQEFPVEEDYWIAGIEYADSVGIDVVNSSIGYSTFDYSSLNHSQSQLDGKSVGISHSATMASDKGMLLFVAAGNEGNKIWKKITFPADAEDVLAVGSVRSDHEISDFSSFGPTVDKRIKPDLVSMGSYNSLIDGYGGLVYASGTSFASPVLAGLGACLWQALPYYTNKQIMELLIKNSDRYNKPDSVYGHGIPDVYKAYTGAQTKIQSVEKNSLFLYVDPNSNRLHINIEPSECNNCKLVIFSVLGAKVLERTALTESVDISMLTKGVYIAYLDVKGKRYVRKFIQF